MNSTQSQTKTDKPTFTKSVSAYLRKYWMLVIAAIILAVFSNVSIKSEMFLPAAFFISFLLIIIFFMIISIFIDKNPRDRIYFVTVLLALCSPLLIYVIALTARIIKNPFIQIGSSGDWIGFAGSIIGGAMTLLALIFTIQHEEKKRSEQKIEDDNRYKEDKASNYLPIFEVKNIGKYDGKFQLNITSVTNKPLRDFVLSNQEFGDNSLVNNLFNLEDIPLLSNAGDYSILLDIDYGRLPKKYSNFPILTTIYFTYSDALLIKRYTHKCQLFLRFEKDDSPEGYRFCTIEYTKNYPIYESHFYVSGEYPIVLELESE